MGTVYVCKPLRKMLEQLRLWKVTGRCSSRVSGSAWLPDPLCPMRLPGVFLAVVSQPLLCSAFSNSFKEQIWDVSGADRLSHAMRRRLCALQTGRRALGAVRAAVRPAGHGCQLCYYSLISQPGRPSPARCSGAHPPPVLRTRVRAGS